MLEAGRRVKNQPAPPWAVYEALTEPAGDPQRLWLTLLDDEAAPRVVESRRPTTVVWSSLWEKRPDARIRFDLSADGETGGTELGWILTVEESLPDPSFLGHMRKRINELINMRLRYSFGQ